MTRKELRAGFPNTDDDTLVDFVKDIADEIWLRGFELAVFFDAERAKLTVVRKES